MTTSLPTSATATWSTPLSASRSVSLFIAATPWLALLALLGVKAWGPPTANMSLAYVALCATYLHINLGYVRSHGNPRIFRRFKVRLIVVPLLLLLALTASPWLLMMAAIVAIHWDSYHTAMQTFGLARLYDVQAGNPPLVGRGLDRLCCLALECLPSVWLLTKLPLHDLADGLASEVGWQPSPHHLSLLQAACPILRMVMVSFLVVGLLVYGRFLWQQRAQAYRLPLPKFVLLSGTAVSGCLMATSFTIMDYAIVGNLYHALQYLALLWLSEAQPYAVVTPHPQRSRHSKRFLVAVLSLMIAALALAVFRIHSAGWSALAAFWLSSSLLHFWSDGFIWSRQRRHGQAAGR